MKYFWNILFWGALWGITEATIGHFLHVWALPIGWLIWFPLAYGFMWAAYRKNGKPNAVFFTALIASAIKLIDLVNPVRLDYVINPAVSILLEGLAVFAIFKASLDPKVNDLTSLRAIGFVSILWRSLYALYISFLPSPWIKISPVAGVLPLARFLLLESAVNCLLIYGIFRVFPQLRRKFRYHDINPHPALSLGMFLIACFMQWKF